LQRAETNGIHFEMKGAVAMVRLSRPAKRNALNDGLIEALRDVFQNLPEEAKAAVVFGEGDHFCAGLDLSELKERDAGQGVYHSRSWHVALDAVQLGQVPVVAALHGAVVGGGLELASACHIAWQTTAPSMLCPRAHAVFLWAAVALFAFPNSLA
jgi:enoyl-CoA hydratase/carnithine racemase